MKVVKGRELEDRARFLYNSGDNDDHLSITPSLNSHLQDTRHQTNTKLLRVQVQSSLSMDCRSTLSHERSIAHLPVTIVQHHVADVIKEHIKPVNQGTTTESASVSGAAPAPTRVKADRSRNGHATREESMSIPEQISCNSNIALASYPTFVAQGHCQTHLRATHG